MLRGKVAMIYHDPTGLREPEGLARLVSRVNSDDYQKIVQEWNVVFLDEEESLGEDVKFRQRRVMVSPRLNKVYRGTVPMKDFYHLKRMDESGETASLASRHLTADERTRYRRIGGLPPKTPRKS